MLKKKRLFGLFDGEIAGLSNLIVRTVNQGIIGECDQIKYIICSFNTPDL